MKKNQLTTHKSSVLLLGKSKSLMKITKKLLDSKSKELANHKDITIIGDLMWEKETRDMQWDNGMEYAKNLRLGGYDDWRLPTKEELFNVGRLCLNQLNNSNDWYSEPFQVAYAEKGFSSGYYWTSELASLMNSVNFVSLKGGIGGSTDKICKCYVRCVRDGQ